MGRRTKKVESLTAEQVLGTSRDADARLAQMAAVAEEFGTKGWRPAPQVLKKVEAVPTIFPQYDYGTRIGGHPLARVMTIHGPSSEGKTSMTMGLMLSFLKAGHFAALIDAECTSPIDWCERLMAGYANTPAFQAIRPQSYEETDDAFRHFCTTIGNAREKGRIPADTSGIVVVDSIRKLVPQKLFAKLTKEGALGAKGGGIDGMSGRAAQYKAALNAQWLDEVVPLLHHTNCTLVIIAREAEDPNADANDRMYGNDWKVTGGKSIIYDASLAARITRAGYVTQGSDEKKCCIGERHQVRVYKSKVAGKDDKFINCFFHTSNGKLVPEGFDPTRDLLEMAIKFEMVTREGSWLKWGARKYQGDAQFVYKVTTEPGLFDELNQQVRAGFGIEPEFEEDGK
jgi:RecA/RadA recombinase